MKERTVANMAYNYLKLMKLCENGTITEDHRNRGIQQILSDAGDHNISAKQILMHARDNRATIDEELIYEPSN